MSGEDGEVDDGPPVLVAFEYPPEETGTELPFDNEEPPDVVNHGDMNNNNDDANNNHYESEDEGEASSQDAGEVMEEGEDQESTKTSSDSKRRKRRHHRRSKSHRKKESSKKDAKDMIHQNLVAAASGVGEWATLFSMYQQQFPTSQGDDNRALLSKIPGEHSPSNKRKESSKSQYEVDDADPYATPEVSDEEGGNGPQQAVVTKEPFGDHNTANSYHNHPPDYQGQSYPHESSYPPRKRIRDETFGSNSHDRSSSPFRGRDRYYSDRPGRGYRHGGGGPPSYDDYYDDRRRSPSEHWGRGGPRRERGGRRGRHEMGPPRRNRGDYNDYDQPQPEMPVYESRQFDDGYSPPNHNTESFHPRNDYVPPRDFDHDQGFGHPPESFDGPRSFGDEDRIYSGRGRDRVGRGRKLDRGGQHGPPAGGPPPPEPQARAPPPDRPGMICKFFREGNCLKGNNCNFAHLLPSEIKRKPELCKFYLGGFCIKGNDCDYMHEQFPCKFFHISGNCRNADHCRFSHALLDDEGRKMLDKAIASWSNAASNPQDGQFYPPEDQQGQPGVNNYPPPPQQQQPYSNGNGTQSGALYGNDVLGGPEQPNANGAPPSFQSPPQPFPPSGFEIERPPFEAPQPPFQGGAADFMPPPPNFPPIPPFPGANQPPGSTNSFFPPPPPIDMNSPPQFRPPNPADSGFPPSSPQMPPLPPTLSAEQIHQLATRMPGMPPPPPFVAQSPSMLPNASDSSSSTPTTASDPRVNRSTTDVTSTSNANRLVRYKLLPVLIPPPVPLSLALKLDPLDPIIRLDPRLRKVFGVSAST